jgi:hypothetical protein
MLNTKSILFCKQNNHISQTKENELTNLKNQAEKILNDRKNIVRRIWDINQQLVILSAKDTNKPSFSTDKDRCARLLKEKQLLERKLKKEYSDEKIDKIKSKLEKEFSDEIDIHEPYAFSR